MSSPTVERLDADPILAHGYLGAPYVFTTPHAPNDTPSMSAHASGVTPAAFSAALRLHALVVACIHYVCIGVVKHGCTKP